MKSRLMLSTLFVVSLTVSGGCGGSGERENYDVVQEGSASGVTSTIQGPGDSLPPITGTNADTTTAFSINPNIAASATPAATPQAAQSPVNPGAVVLPPTGAYGDFRTEPAPASRPAPTAAAPPSRSDESWRTETREPAPTRQPQERRPAPVPQPPAEQPAPPAEEPAEDVPETTTDVDEPEQTEPAPEPPPPPGRR